MTTPPIVPPKPTGPVLELPAGLDLVYANLARIAHSPADIVIDFAHILPGEQTARIRSRVVMSPLSAKLLMRALAENIARYEAAFGEIHMPSNNTLADSLFKPFQPPAPPASPTPPAPEPPKES
jgi:hypothetical protein